MIPEDQSAPAQDEPEVVSPIKDEHMVEKKNPNILERFWFVPVILAVIILLGIGGFWLYNQNFSKTKVAPGPVATLAPVVNQDEDISGLEKQGSSDEPTTIEADLDATDLSNLDKELEEIETELATP